MRKLFFLNVIHNAAEGRDKKLPRVLSTHAATLRDEGREEEAALLSEIVVAVKNRYGRELLPGYPKEMTQEAALAALRAAWGDAGYWFTPEEVRLFGAYRRRRVSVYKYEEAPGGGVRFEPYEGGVKFEIMEAFHRFGVSPFPGG